MYIDYITRDDYAELMIIWRSQSDKASGYIFGIPYKTEIYEMIDEKRFLCVRDNNKMIAICGFKVQKRNPIVKLCNIWVDPNYRRKRIATTMMAEVLKRVDESYYPVISCKDGAENNSFYESLKLQNYTIKSTNVMKVRTYILDREKINNKINIELKFTNQGGNKE